MEELRGRGRRGPQVSVVIPTHNRRDLLAITLRSVSWQEEVDLEVIVVDDGSEDGTRDVVEGMDDARVRLVRHDTPRGVSAARNRGIAEAAGEWLAFLDDDDLWAPNKLASQLEAARRDGSPWVYTGSVNVTTDHRVVGGAPPPPPGGIVEGLTEINVVPGGCSGVLARKRSVLEVGGFDEGLRLTEDWDLWRRLVGVAVPACVGQPLVAYRVHGQNKSLDTERMEYEFHVVGERYGGANYAMFHRYLGWWSLRVSNRRSALRYFTRAALGGNASYAPRAYVSDIGYLARHVAESARLRYCSRIIRRSLLRVQTDIHQEWKAEGQLWVDRLVARSSNDV